MDHAVEFLVPDRVVKFLSVSNPAFILSAVFNLALIGGWVFDVNALTFWMLLQPLEYAFGMVYAANHKSVLAILLMVLRITVILIFDTETMALVCLVNDPIYFIASFLNVYLFYHPHRDHACRDPQLDPLLPHHATAHREPEPYQPQDTNNNQGHVHTAGKISKQKQRNSDSDSKRLIFSCAMLTVPVTQAFVEHFSSSKITVSCADQILDGENTTPEYIWYWIVVQYIIVDSVVCSTYARSSPSRFSGFCAS